MARKKQQIIVEEPKVQELPKQTFMDKVEAWANSNKTYIILIAGALILTAIAMSLSDPMGVIPPSVDKKCCDSFCAKATGYGECHRWTQEYIMCKIPENLTSTVQQINGSSPVYDFWVYDIKTVCGDALSDA